MKRDPFKRLSQLSLRIALYSGVAVALAVTGLSLLIGNHYSGLALLQGFLSGAFVMALTYYISSRLQYKRMKTLHRIIGDIASKRFGEYEKLPPDNSDELDYLIKQAVKASKTIEREIQRQKRIENYRKEFIGDISHELKTPIFAVQGFIETLLNGALDDEEVNRQFLEKAMRNVNRLIYLTKDLMEISRLETGKLKSDIRDIYLQNVAGEVVESLQYRAEEDNISLQLKNIDADILVSADRNQIKQVLINLVENAIKYNTPGGLVIIGTRPFDKNAGKILVYVEDTGIGIEQKNLERVTERFFRVDKSRSRKKGGTGLGLAIVKHIMEVHGEEIFIESSPNAGSTFSFTLTKADQIAAHPR